VSEALPPFVWTYHNPVRIVAGIGALTALPKLVTGQGNVLLVTTPGFTSRGMTANLVSQLGAERVLIYDEVTPNPQLDSLDKATERFRGQGIQSIVALGGGSALDAGKILGVTLAGSLPNPLDNIFRHNVKHTWDAGIPVVAVPTTAGTGAEVTPFATVWDETTHKKHSVTGDQVYPSHALLDPDLTLPLPYQETLYTGLDAISHALESLWNKNKTPVSEALAIEALALANKALPVVLKTPNDIAQRAKMQTAAVLAGLAISQTRTAIAHSISYPLTSRYNIPHGLACGFTLVQIYTQYHLRDNEILGSATVQSTIEILDELSLGNHVQEYVLGKNISEFIQDMHLPERTDNFIENMDRAALNKILLTSLSRT